MRHRITLMLAALILAACSDSTPPGPATPDAMTSGDDRNPTASVHSPERSLLAGNPYDVALATSTELFESSPGAILTSEAKQIEAASLAHNYHVPVLIDGPGVGAELDRLGVEWVITVDVEHEDFDNDSDYVAIPTTTEAEHDNAVDVVGGESVDDLLALGEGEALTAPIVTDTNLSVETDDIQDLIVLTDGSAPVALGTARAAGATVLLAPTDPRASTDTIHAISTSPAVLGIYSEELPDFDWQVETARTGVELPGGNQLVFPGKRYIALYGTPGTSALGVLGEQDVPSTVARAEDMADPYRALTDDTIIPAHEIIVTVAAGAAGDDGNYSHEGPIDRFIPLIEAAQEAGHYVILDFQPGRSDFLSQLQLYEELLNYPHVGVALDPEWRLGPDDVPLTRIGHVNIDEVNEVVNYLADFVQERNLPQKLIVLHQFQRQMIRDRELLDLSRSEVAILIHADGQGSQPAKNATWAMLHEDAPDDVYWGWKNFIDEDHPMLNPEETFTVEPTPDFVSYQ